MIYKVLFICLLLITQSANAEIKPSCSEQVLNAVAYEIGLKKLTDRNSISVPFKVGQLIIAAECKAWPWDPQKLIAAIAYYPEGHKFYQEGLKFDAMSNVDDSKNFVLAIISTKSGQVLSLRQWSIRADIGPESLNIDTARYDFAPGVRAFGLDIFENYRQVPTRSGQGGQRTLYIENGKNLQPVLSNFILSSWRLVDENKGVTSLAEHSKYHIIIDQKKANGFRNLIIKKSVFYQVADPKQPAHKHQAHTQRALETKISLDRVLYFNGVEYLENKGA